MSVGTMDKATSEHAHDHGGGHNTHDRIQSQLSAYAAALDYQDLNAETVHATKVRVIDTFAALIAGFAGAPCEAARSVAAVMPQLDGATVIGTALKTTPDMAAFVNGSTSRYVELNDVHHWPGSGGGHPSDVVMPILAIAEQAGRSGRDFMTAVVLGYEIYLQMTDAVKLPGFDKANFCTMGSALGAGKLLGLDTEGLAQALSMAVVPNNSLNQARTGHLSMWKAVAAGQAGRAGVFAAIIAKAGMRGPYTPFEGKAGWNDHVARKRYEFDKFGDKDTPFRILRSLIKPRPSCATTISSILAAEKIAPQIDSLASVQKVTVEVYERAKSGMATGEHHWNPDSRETADHSIPYVTAAALFDGTVTPESFSDARLYNADLRTLLAKIEVIENPEFTEAYERVPVEHRTRVTVTLQDGRSLVGYAGGDAGDLSKPKTDAEIEEKFLRSTTGRLGAKRAESALSQLWKLDDVTDVSGLPPLFSFS